MTLVWVMVAGGLGSGARYLVAQWAAGSLGPAFPHGTLIVNVLGCFALGMLVQVAASGGMAPDVRAAIGVGFIGGFTTYSTFNQETLSLLASGATGAAAANVAVTLLAGLAAGTLGLWAGRAFT